MSNKKLDIRTSANARTTLVELTNVDILTWERYKELYISRSECRKDLMEDVIKSYGQLPNNFIDLEIIFSHITTSANDCASFNKYGILDLRKAYFCQESEIRIFLDRHNIFLDLEKKILTSSGKPYDITYCSRDIYPCGTLRYLCWLIGRKFYYDYQICGFLSIDNEKIYGGRVDLRPEILLNIDKLLGSNLSVEWEESHCPYEITAQVKGSNIVFPEDEDNSDKDKVLTYLTMAYETAFFNSIERVLITKSEVQIPPTDIIEISPLSFWR